MDETRCPKCNEILEIGSWPFCRGGHGKGQNNVIDDTIIGGEVLEHLGDKPITVYSKSERRRVIRDTGHYEYVRHVPRPDGKRPDTSRWI